MTPHQFDDLLMWKTTICFLTNDLQMVVFPHLCKLEQEGPMLSHVGVPFRGLPCRTRERGGIRVPGAQWTVHERHFSVDL